MKKYTCDFKLAGVSIRIHKIIDAENKTEANNIFKDYIKNTIPERASEYNKESVSIKEDN